MPTSQRTKHTSVVREKVGFIELVAANRVRAAVPWGASIGGRWEKLRIAFGQVLGLHKEGLRKQGASFPTTGLSFTF